MHRIHHSSRCPSPSTDRRRASRATRTELGRGASVKDMNRNRHNTPRDETTRMVFGRAHQSDRSSWLRTLGEIRELREIAA